MPGLLLTRNRSLPRWRYRNEGEGGKKKTNPPRLVQTGLFLVCNNRSVCLHVLSDIVKGGRGSSATAKVRMNQELLREARFHCRADRLTSSSAYPLPIVIFALICVYFVQIPFLFCYSSLWLCFWSFLFPDIAGPLVCTYWFVSVGEKNHL